VGEFVVGGVKGQPGENGDDLFGRKKRVESRVGRFGSSGDKVVEEGIDGTETRRVEMTPDLLKTQRWAEGLVGRRLYSTATDAKTGFVDQQVLWWRWS